MKFVSSRPGLAGVVLFAMLMLGGAVSPSQAADPSCSGGKVKYYRNPMGTPDTSPVPKKDSMNMDYIPVCEDETGDSPGAVKISLDKVQRLGVRSAEVQERTLARTVRAFASLQFDERRQFVVAPKFGGWIEKLLVNATGDPVTRGQTLFEVYSPELNVLQQEWNLAGRTGYATDKLRNLDYPEAAMDKLRRGERSRTIAIPSPITGTVIDKTAVEGARSRPAIPCSASSTRPTCGWWPRSTSRTSRSWKVGDLARVTVNTWPERPFEGRGHLHLSECRQGEPHRAAQDRGHQSRWQAARRHGRHCRDRLHRWQAARSLHRTPP